METDARGFKTTFELDRIGRVVAAVDPDGFRTTTAWDGVNKVGESDKRGNVTTHAYDAINRLRRTTDPAPFDQQKVEGTYDDAGNRVTERDRRGFIKVSQYDALGRLRSVVRSGVTLERHEYDGSGNRSLTRDAEDRITRFEYDPANRLSRRLEAPGTPVEAATTFKHDENGNVLEERDARAAALGAAYSVKRTYDRLNRLETETDGEGNETGMDYDPEGNRISLREPKGQVTAYDYDELGKLSKVTPPPPASGQPQPVTRHDYDEARNRIRQTDANGHVVELTYDKLNRLATLTQDPGGLGLLTRHDYDEDGREKLLTDAKGQKVTSLYDELGRLKSKSYAFAPGDPVRPWRHTTLVTYAYDENSNLRRTEDSVASGSDPPGSPLVTTRTWDTLDRLETETATLPEGGTRTVEHSYYGNGLRKTVKDPAGRVTLYTYDERNRLQTATTGSGSPEAATTRYTYLPDSLPLEVTYPNGVKATHAYDRADRLTRLTNLRGPATVSAYAYGYDKNGNRLSQVETNGGVSETTTYTYDGLDRLTTVTYPVDASFPGGRVVTYGYDSVGNRIRETEKTTGGAVLADKQGVFDNTNRLTALNDLVSPVNSTSFGWDANGNQTAKTVGTGPGAVTTEYRYDIRDKMVETVQGVSILGRFQYDCEGRRTKKIGEEGLRQYVYDQTSLLLEYDNAGNQVAEYDYGSDRLISLFRRDEPRRYFSLDGLRSVVNLTDDSGSVAASYHLDVWGNFRFPAELTTSKNRFAFTGYEWDPETGLFNAKARYFDPALGRFLSQDTFLGEIDEPPSLHRYFYGYANPLRYVDPTGHAAGDLWDPRSYDWKVFGQEFGTRLGETGANIATLGGYGGVKRAYNEGRITDTDVTSAGRAYAEGVFNAITLGAGERSVGAYAEGKSAGGIAVEGVKGAGETVVPINEFKALADPTKSGWEKAEAIATATTKFASLAAGGLAAKNALAQRAAARAAVASESAAGAEAALTPAEGALPPARPLPRVAGGSQAADVAQTAEQAALRQRVLANVEQSRLARESSNFEVLAAKDRQIAAAYNPDAWTMTKLSEGQLVYGGYPGQTPFYMDLAAVKASRLSRTRLFESLQVAPNPLKGYRPEVRAYRLKETVRVPTGLAAANPGFGFGGARQLFIDDFDKVLVPIRTFQLSK